MLAVESLIWSWRLLNRGLCVPSCTLAVAPLEPLQLHSTSLTPREKPGRLIQLQMTDQGERVPGASATGKRSPLPWPSLLEKLLYFELCICGILHSLAEQMTRFLIPDMGKTTGMRGEYQS